jgi:hypothetical protein
MDCKTARLLLDFHRPRAGELAPEEAAALEGHLASCPDCDAAGRAARRLDDHLGRAVRDVPVPDRLRERLLARLKEERRAARLRKVAWAARGVAAAAAVLLVGVLVWWWAVASAKPGLDLGGLYLADQRKHQAESPENVQVWFQERRNLTLDPPPRFNYDYLAEYELTEWQHRPVPKFVFFRPDSSTRARVYVISGDQFDLSRLPAEPGGFDTPHVVIWRLKEAPNTAYVIMYDGDSLAPLLREPPPVI